MVWKQPRPETLETARSESSRDPETQKLHGLKAAETKTLETAWSESSRDPEIYRPSQIESDIKLKSKLKLKLKIEEIERVKKFGNQKQR